MKGVIYNESPDERTERFMRLVEAEERRRLKEERRSEIKKDQEVMKICRRLKYSGTNTHRRSRLKKKKNIW